MDVQHLLEAIRQRPHLAQVSITTVLSFVRFALMAKPFILFHTVNSSAPPALPSLSVQILLSKCVAVEIEMVKGLWTAFKDLIWQCKALEDPSHSEMRVYNQHALPLGTSFRHLYPPVRVCQTKRCRNHRDTDEIKTLSDPVTYKGSLFTLRQGALPVFSTSVYCSKCNRRYHHNYVVHAQSSTEEYYSGVPGVIQASKHHFLDAPLLEFIVYAKVFGWLSSRNLARLYNFSLANVDSVLINNERAFGPYCVRESPLQRYWQTSLKLQEEHVMNGFFLYSLLLEKAERHAILALPHQGLLRDRLQIALSERNKQMEGVGQESYTHACDLCYIIFQDDNGRYMKLQAAVTDGDTIGHPCCAVHDCKIPLLSNRDHYCPQHTREYHNRCAVTDCTATREDGFRTCKV
ncbi:hypothetical protein CPC08DRAFT_824680 [Agrocybe pediades]|nr:hypothetical protein CPC08DRAFT_824680 [Agrocybe pediades]